MTQDYSTARRYPSICSAASTLRPSSLRLALRLVTAWSLTHSFSTAALLMLRLLLTIRTSITEEFVLRTSCDLLFTYQHRDPAGSLFLCLNRIITCGNFMPRGRLQKVDIDARVLKLKTELYEGKYNGASEEWLNGAHHSLNMVLDILQEYSS